MEHSSSYDAWDPLVACCFVHPTSCGNCFNAQQFEEAFYHTETGQEPFDEEAIAECFAGAKREDFPANQKVVLKESMQYFPGQFRAGLWAVDSVDLSTPKGARVEPGHSKSCVLGICRDSVVRPALWLCEEESVCEITVGKEVLAAAEDEVGPGFIRHLLIDRGFIDGPWITRL